MEQNNFEVEPDKALSFLPEQYGAAVVADATDATEVTLGTAPTGDLDGLDPGIDGYRLKIIIRKSQ